MVPVRSGGGTVKEYKRCRNEHSAGGSSERSIRWHYTTVTVTKC